MLALIGAAFTTSFATSAFAAEEFDLRPAIDSNQTVHVGQYLDHAAQKIKTVRYTVSRIYYSVTYRLERAGQLEFGPRIVRATTVAKLDCWFTACPSYQAYRSWLYPGWEYQWVLYRGWAWLLWYRG